MIRQVLLAVVLIGALAAVCVGAQRWQVERSNRTVELTVEYPELKQMSALFRVPTPQLLQQIREDGVTSVALQEQTLHQLVDDGDVFRPDPFTDPRVKQLLGSEKDATIRRTVLAFPDAALRQRVELNLGERWGNDRVHEVELGAMPALIVDGNFAQFRDLGVGLDPAAQAEVRQAGLGIIGRVKSYAGLSPVQIEWIMKDLKADGAHAVIFLGDDVMGQPTMVGDTARILRAQNLPWGYVELGKQHGEDQLAAALGGWFIRVHTVQGSEFSNMTPHAVVDRFVQAVRERNIRICYVHLLSSITSASLVTDEDFVRSIGMGMKGAGFRLGLAQPFPDWKPAAVVLAIIAAGLAAGLALLALELTESLSTTGIALLAGLLLGLVAGFLKARLEAIQAAALLAALIFPSLSMLRAHFPTEDSGLLSTAPPAPHRGAALLALRRMLITSLFSLLGALYIIGFLSSSRFMSKTNQFLGVKPAILLPVVFVFAVYWGRLLDPGPFALRWARLREKVNGLLRQPILIQHAVVAVIALVVLYVLVSRSGNDSSIGASTFELKTRHILDGWLIARPRTKEFLLGNPALFLAFYAAARGWRRWVLPLLAVGAIGQTSLVDTFCHIHTPLYISIFHAINGLWLGALIGWAVSVVWEKAREEGRSRSLRRKVHVRVVLSGYYGFGNAGDEAILVATIEGIKRHIPEADIVVLSANPGYTTRITGAAAVPRSSFKAIRKSMEPGGLLVSGGGGLLQDTTSVQSVFYYLGVIQIARSRKMKTMVHSQGIGPLNRWISRAAVRSVLRKVDQITVRDRTSGRLLTQLGVTERPLLTADPAFGLKPETVYRGQEILAAEGVPTGGPLLAVTMRTWPELGIAGKAEIGETLGQAVDKLGVHIVFVGMHHPDDVKAARELVGRVRRSFTVLQKEYLPAELAAILEASKAVVAMRLHGMILASISGSPSVAMSYDPKVEAIARQLELPWVDLKEVTCEKLLPLVEAAVNSTATQRDELATRAAAQRRMADEAYVLMAMLAKSGK